MAGLADKTQITATFAGTLNGKPSTDLDKLSADDDLAIRAHTLLYPAEIQEDFVDTPLP